MGNVIRQSYFWMRPNRKNTYAEVAPAVPMPGTGKQTYTYRIPTGLRGTLGLYSQVSIPLGKRRVKGFVVELHSRAAAFPTKELGAPQNSQLTAHQVDFARWIAGTMHGGLGYTLRLFLPPRKLSAEFLVTQAQKLPRVTPLALALIRGDANKRHKQLAGLLRVVVSNKQQVVVLVPEVWMIELVMTRLGKTGAHIAAMHSGLTPKEATQVWHQVQAGEIDIVVGTQKALYLPYHRLGAVVIEEEWYPIHKMWDAYPRLDGRYGARALANIHQASVVYSSSISSPELVWREQQQQVLLMSDDPLRVRCQMIAASFEDRQQKWPVPREVLALLHKWMNAKQRVLVVQHQSATAVRHSLHQRFDAYMQKIDTRTKVIDPQARLLVGTTAAFRLLADELVDHVMLLFPEKMLGYPDYRSQERVLQLLARLQQTVPAREKVVIVTRAPQVIEGQVLAAFSDTFSSLLTERQQLGLPPTTDAVRLTIAARTARTALQRAGVIREQLEAAKPDGVQVYGPFTTSEPARAGQHHAQLLLTGPLAALQLLYKDAAIATADLAPERIL